MNIHLKTTLELLSILTVIALGIFIIGTLISFFSVIIIPVLFGLFSIGFGYMAILEYNRREVRAKKRYNKYFNRGE